jgi:hypothetical protein
LLRIPGHTTVVNVIVEADRIRVGDRFSVTFQRTLRVPEDGRVYPLPPGLGRLPVHRARDYRERVPELWWRRDDIFIPIHQREALWLALGAAAWKPNAVKIAVGRINALTGQPWDERLREDPQDYIVCPDQPWLDGINAGQGEIRQFVAMPLGSGYTVEGQVTGEERYGGLQILVFEPKPGEFPDQPPEEERLGPVTEAAPPKRTAEVMGLSAGGRIRQKIYPDPYGIDTWDQENTGSVFVHLVNEEQHRDLTGVEPPPSPVSARTYTEWGLPWFELYDEHRGSIPSSDVLANVKSVLDRDAEVGEPSTAADASADVPKAQVKTISPPPKRPRPEQGKAGSTPSTA